MEKIIFFILKASHTLWYRRKRSHPWNANSKTRIGVYAKQKYRLGFLARTQAMTMSDRTTTAQATHHTLLKLQPALNPQDIADTATFLASDRARFISGEVVDVALDYNALYTA
ncbi:SDR family oxidoreductase [Funiculus sociatus GB2-A5]|uniref:SDR family oxidoreductase n=1 Tax=Funiculus sociatus GB2-A5 TaxID=2933946 RepID=A0ABV0JWK1_9CYAN|nr:MULTISPECIES: SDR family oxidoreductase [unclassified Trichocoleus]MBD1904206.1 SDR family oxidoreductase [Trichocoleus sp. FACHB-832]MBD2061170.1 SDR family oxidoreductase [Trichocoleus sp. FACHB-6]